jgi:dihydroxyacetone kinase
MHRAGHRTAQLSSSAKVVSDLLSQMTSTTDADRSFVPWKGDDEVVLLVNNLGGLPELELGIVARDAGQWLASNRFTVVRVLVGTFMTSFAMPGCSLSLVRLPKRGEDDVDRDVVLDALDAQADAPGWKWSYKGKPDPKAFGQSEDKEKAAVAASGDEEARGPARAFAVHADVYLVLKDVHSTR